MSQKLTKHSTFFADDPIRVATEPMNLIDGAERGSKHAAWEGEIGEKFGRVFVPQSLIRLSSHLAHIRQRKTEMLGHLSGPEPRLQSSPDRVAFAVEDGRRLLPSGRLRLRL